MTRTLAFPGAEGYGAGALGGAYAGATPTIYRVTNLNDSGVGSLRAALTASGRRIVVFNTGGTIELDSPILVSNPYLTILGQTAPPDSGGITIKNSGSCSSAPVQFRAGEVICRYVRFRCGPSTFATSSLAAITTGDPNTANVVGPLIFDHCSFSWSVDQVATTWYATRNVTFQWCIFSEGLHCSNHEKNICHSKGLHMGNASGGNISVHHCLLAHSVERNPMCVTSASYPIEIINCVGYNNVYNVMLSTNYGASPKVDVIKNYYKSGPSSNANVYEVEPQTTADTSYTQRVYVEGNIGPHRPTDDLAENLVVDPSWRHFVVGSRYASPTVPVTETSAAQAYLDVVNHAGCRVPMLDSVDERILNDVVAGTGSIINSPADVGGWPTLAAGTGWADTDSDGLPDSYEADAGSVAATDTAPDGYLHIESWANSLIGEPITPGEDEPATGYTDVQISSSDADISIYTTGVDELDYPVLSVGHFAADEYNYWACLVFENVQIAQGWTVSEAYLRINVAGINTATLACTIVGYDADDAALFDGSYDDAFDRVDADPTTATVAWTPDAVQGWQQSPNIASIINEIVGRAGWNAGNNLCIVVQPTTQTWSSQQRIKFYPYDADPSLAPILRYSAPQSAGGGAGATIGQNLQVAASGDDGYTLGSNTTYYGASSLWVGDYNTSLNYIPYIRFVLDYAIPDGSTVDEATVEVKASGISSSIPPVTIRAVDDDDAAAITNYADANGRAVTTASVVWTPSAWTTGTWYESVDIKSIIQELVDTHSGLAAGAYIMVRMNWAGTGGGTSRIRFESYDDSPANAPKLHITHTEPGSSILLQRTLQQPLRVGMRSGMRI